MATNSKAPFLIRFGGKRLRKFVDSELSAAKRDVIATSCFADLAMISWFHVPEELLEWVLMNIDPKLREYRHKIVYDDHLDFPVEQVHGHVFDYSLPRALHVCNADFELAMAIDRNKKTPELSVFGKRPISDQCNTPYALYQAPLAPQYVPLVQGQPAHQEPPLVQGQPAPQLPHVAQAQLAPQPPHVVHAQSVLQHPHVAQAQPAPQAFAEVDASVNGSEAFVEPCATLVEWLQNSMPPVQDLGVPTEFNALYEKHKSMFKREDVSDAARNDSVQEGTNESNGINFDVSNMDPKVGFCAGVSMGGVGSSPIAAPIIEEASVGIGGGFGAVIGDAVVSTMPVHTVDSTKDSSVPPRPPSPTPVAADAPIMDLSKNGGEGYENFIRELTPSNLVHSLPSHVFQNVALSTTPSPTHSAGPTANNLDVASYLIFAEFRQVEKTIDELTSGLSMHKKRTRHKRVAVDFDSVPKMKMEKVKAYVDALYTKYVLHKQNTKKLEEGESHPPCFKIGGFYTSYQNWQASLRPRGDLDNEVMALYIKHFNLSHKSSRKCKKYTFSCLISELLFVNPARFVPNINYLREFNRACDDFKAHKSDLIANFVTLVKQTKIIKLDIALFPRVNLDEYP
ncbi:hypothetical protein ACQ4PT_047798 [Festuca glaucescens]